MKSSRLKLLCASAAIALAWSTRASAQAWPAKPIRWVVPYTPAGITDTGTRMVLQKVQENTGWNIVVENKPGANSLIGVGEVARAPADGYTLLFATSSVMVTAPALYAKLSFDMPRDFAPISLVMNGPNVLVVHPSLPVRTVKEFVALAKARPGDIKYTSAGAGTLPHLGMELLRYMTKINLLHVAYKGGGPAMVALVSGECDASMYTLLTASPHIASGRLRAIGVSGKTRFKALPDVPTIAESGVPDYEFNAWVGVLAPAATPPAIIRLLNEHVVKAARSPVAAERLTRDGAEVVASTPEAFRARIAADTAV